MRIRIQEASHPRCGSRSTSVEYLTTLDYRGMRLWSDLVHVGWKCRPCHSCQCWGARSLWGSAARAAWADTPGGNAGGTWRIRPRRACPGDQWSSPKQRQPVWNCAVNCGSTFLQIRLLLVLLLVLLRLRPLPLPSPYQTITITFVRSDHYHYLRHIRPLPWPSPYQTITMTFAKSDH